MGVNCLGCGHTLVLGEAYDDYDGSVRCNVCRAILHIASHDGRLSTVELLDDQHCRTASQSRGSGNEKRR